MSKNFTACKKVISKYEQGYFEGQIYHFIRQASHALLLDGSDGRIARELLWSNHGVLPVDIIPP
jgi:phosphatidylserine synthase